jgi:deoxycytidylate deaminase
MIDYGLFRLAKIASTHSPFDKRFRLGAVISKGRRPISIGFNKLKTHAKWPTAFSLHAELSALLAKRFEDIVGANIWVYRETVDGIPAKARPCKICMAALAEAGISKVYYSVAEFPYWTMEEIK